MNETIQMLEIIFSGVYGKPAMKLLIEMPNMDELDEVEKYLHQNGYEIFEIGDDFIIAMSC